MHIPVFGNVKAKFASQLNVYLPRYAEALARATFYEWKRLKSCHQCYSKLAFVLDV